MNMAEHYNRLYVQYACLETNTDHNYMLSLRYREKYGQLTNDQQILNEVKQARKAFKNSKRENKTVILLPFSKNTKTLDII